MNPTIAQIKATVAARHHFSVKAIDSGLRKSRLVRSRHLAMYLAWRLSGKTLTVIAKHFGGRDHTTIIHACRKVQLRVHRNQKTRIALASFIDELTKPDPVADLQRILAHIDDPSARKIVIMAKHERGELTDQQTERLIRDGGLVNA